MATSEREFGVGLIGLGGAAGAMIGKFAKNPHFRVAAAADIDPEIIDRFHKDYPDAETYSSAEGLCESKSVDLVYIATPNRFHTEHARMALESKKNVLIEKPMTIELEGAQDMIDTAARSGVLLGVNVKHSFEPRVLKLREFARTGELRAAAHDQLLAVPGLALSPADARGADAGVWRRHPLAAGARTSSTSSGRLAAA